MPLYGLPKILENNINNILDCSELTSWNIRGDTSNVQVTIRFTQVEPSDMTRIDTSNITYRKAPPSQLRRDRERALSHRFENRKDRLVLNL